jgi:hypothetical protein
MQEVAPEDRVELSTPSSEHAHAYDRTGKVRSGRESGRTPGQEDEQGGAEEKKGADGTRLSGEGEKAVAELKATDAKVRAHEGAHMAAGAGLVRGGASYEMKKGPDGKMYAVAGEVSIDTSGEKDPKATIMKMQRVVAAALAPADPSSQDRSVAAAAGQKMQEAMMEVMQERISEAKGSSGQSAPGQGEAQALAPDAREGAGPSTPYGNAGPSAENGHRIFSLIA